MCGICGWVAWDGAAEERVVRKMCDRLAHRGPDGEGLWRDTGGRVALGHRRLRVLDPRSRSDQPMVDTTGAVLTYNGEVYSFRSARRQLRLEGRRFSTSGDTEVVLAALAEWGPDALERFDGMFALALWCPEGRLLLARDRLGIKPLFWAELRRGLAFASEIPALLAHPGIERRLSREAVGRWLQVGYSSGDETLIRGVHRLPPGHMLEADENGIQVRPWYDLLERLEVAGLPPPTLDAAAEELEMRLREAVSQRLISDVPLGCFLSGGVDSAAVVTTARALGESPQTLTVSFTGGEDESSAARGTASSLDLRHRVVSCAPREMLDVFAGWSRIGGDPIADPSLAPTWVVSRAARQRWTVALSGDGGDELLSGYPRLRLAPRLEHLHRIPRVVRDAARRPLGGPRWQVKLRDALASESRWDAYQVLQGLWPGADSASLLGLDEASPPWPEDLMRRLATTSPWHRYRLLDALTFLPERVLAKVDRASMDHSLEVRVPLLDHRVVELVLSLPGAWAHDKTILRRVVTRLGGPRLDRRKRGFEVPLADWLRGPLRPEVEADLFGDETSDLGLDRAVLRRTWDRLMAGEDVSERLFAVAILTRWARDLR